MVQGPAGTIDAIVAKARVGSPAARVADVTVRDDALAETLDGFGKRPTV